MYRHRQGAAGGSQRPAWGAGHARAASPEPGGGGTPAVSSGAEGGLSGERGEATTREEVIVQLEKENQELKSMISQRDQKISELTRTDLPANRLKKDARALASEVRVVRNLLRERNHEIAELKEKLAKQEKEQANASPSRGAEGDGHLPGGDAAARLTAEQTARLSEQEEQIRKLKTHVDELLQQRNALQQQVADQQFAASQRAAAAAADQSISPVARGVNAGGSSGAVQAVSRSGSYTAPVEETSDVAEMVVYSSKRTEHAATLGKINLQGFGMVEGASHVAKVLLSRIQSSVYSQQRQPAAAPQMHMNMAPGMAAGMTHVQMQHQAPYVGGGYPHMQ